MNSIKEFFRTMLQSSPAALRGRSVIVAALAGLLLLAGCGGPRIITPQPPPLPEGGAAVPEDNKIVLSNDTQLVANAPWGRIKIEAGPGLRRVYSWRGHRRGVVLEPRTERFAGSMGVHYEGKPPVWEPADGITQVDLEEGQRRFENMDDAMIWMQIRRLRYSYTNDGLVVGWKPKGDTLVVELWQFYIDGKKPARMPGADDTRLAMGPLTPVPQKMKPVRLYADGHREPIPEARVVSTSQAKAKTGTDAVAVAEPDPDSEDEGWFGGLFGNNKSDDALPSDGQNDAGAEQVHTAKKPEPADKTASNEAGDGTDSSENAQPKDDTPDQ